MNLSRGRARTTTASHLYIYYIIVPLCTHHANRFKRTVKRASELLYYKSKFNDKVATIDYRRTHAHKTIYFIYALHRTVTQTREMKMKMPSGGRGVQCYVEIRNGRR